LLKNLAGRQGSGGFGEGRASIREDFDYVLTDAPPVVLVSDPAILCTQSDGVLLVRTQDTHEEARRDTMHSPGTVGAKVLGTLMNNVTDGNNGYRYE